MIKVWMLATALCLTVLTIAQPPTPPSPSDTTRRDTLVQDLKDQLLDNIPVVSIDENDLGDASSQNVSSVLTAGRDPYYNAASFNFNAVRFRIRGYDADVFTTYMNGIPVDNLDNGFTPWGLWGGLNDVMRNRDLSIGLRPNTFAFGDIGSTSNIDSRASRQRKQTNIGYAISNRNYTHRFNASYSSGMSKKGWAFTVAGSRRYADEGYIPGTYYNSWSYFAAVDKRLSRRHMLSLAVFGAPTENGRQSGSVREAQDLTGDHYYNPSWGYQNGKKRNANVGKTNQPYFILTHDFTINSKTTLTTAAGYSFGDRSSSAFDWYNTADPRPDYYRYLPSYQLDATLQQMVAEAWQTNPAVSQVDWAKIYDANRASYDTVYNANGVQGSSVKGLRSHYIIEERVVNTKRFAFNSVLNKSIGNHTELTGGIVYQYQKNNYYKRVGDLLGGDFYVNVNQFAERDFPTNDTAFQNDVDNPNGILHVGDRFGYDYDINIQKGSAFVQSVFKYNKWDYFIAGEFSRTQFYRVGNVRNGLFPDNSFGKSATQRFNNYAFKGGITYKLNGRNYFYVSGVALSRAPLFDNVYISPRTRDFVQSNVKSETIQAVEGGYILASPKLRMRLTGYYTKFNDGMNVITGYLEGANTFVNFALNNIDKVHYGTELGIEAKLTSALTLNAAAGIGRYYYNSRQNMTVTVDNTSTAIGAFQDGVVYTQNFRVPSTPQEAYSLGLTYRSPNFWFVSLSGNYFDQMYLDFNPLRRTASAVDGLDLTKPDEAATYHSIVDQTKWKAQYTIDFFGGWSWRLPKSLSVKKPSTLAINAGVNNITNNKDIISGGYEQIRVSNVNIDKFPEKIYYSFGLNYFASVAYRF